MERILNLLKQYRYGILVLILGIGFMLIPSGESREKSVTPVVSESSGDISDSLEMILEKIDGVGKVTAFLTEAEGEYTFYQTDTDTSASSSREDTVVITDNSRNQSGLIRQIIPAKYRGAIIVCQGGDRATVRLAVVDAVSAVTGLTSDKITVLKMK